MHVTEMIIYDLYLFKLPLATIPAIITAAIVANSLPNVYVYLTFSLIYFHCHKFSFQPYIV